MTTRLIRSADKQRCCCDQRRNDLQCEDNDNDTGFIFRKRIGAVGEKIGIHWEEDDDDQDDDTISSSNQGNTHDNYVDDNSNNIVNNNIRHQHQRLQQQFSLTFNAHFAAP